MDSPVERVVGLFCKQYNAKNPDTPLDSAKMLLANKNNVFLPLDGKVSDHILEYNDLFLVHKPEAVQSHSHQGEPGALQCKNLGCNQWYLPEENGEGACHHHTGAPVFHDLAKFWTCCDKKKALDWEEFQSIPTCAVGPHCPEAKVELFKSAQAATMTAVPLTAEEIACQEAAALPTAPAPVEDTPGPIVDGMARCRNKGCNVDRFAVAENHADACHYHEGAPVFHDTAKYWSCCPAKKCYDWDDFLKVPPCAVGPHKV
eukprot:GGOE01043620.1.p2 GENE.GGOE01043620.1~~GGOE01043620.1.p2  ORF type:complete len:300 (-),score=85.86 GGOE01043620.1:445-1221(-)